MYFTFSFCGGVWREFIIWMIFKKKEIQLMETALLALTLDVSLGSLILTQFKENYYF